MLQLIATLSLVPALAEAYTISNNPAACIYVCIDINRLLNDKIFRKQNSLGVFPSRTVAEEMVEADI